jgi:hypothetical protein
MTAVIPARPAGSYARNMRGVYLASVCLHVVAAMTWVGGMVIFVAAVMPYFRNQDDKAREAFLQWFGARFRTLSWSCFAILAMTGRFNLDARRPHRGLATGGVARDRLRPPRAREARPGRPRRCDRRSSRAAATRRQARWLGRSLLLFGLAIVAVAVMLVRAV